MRLPGAVRATALLAVLGVAMTHGSLAAEPAKAAAAHNVSGTWLLASYSARLLPTDGKAIPFTADAKSRYEKAAAALAAGKLADTAHSMCLLAGTPRTLLAPYPFRIFQTPNQVVFIHEANRAYRIVQMSNKHADPDVWDPSYMGDGIGHWEGDELVIDSSNFNDKTWLDDTGLPHGARLHVVERLRSIAGGKQLEDLVTIEDPDNYSRPWTTRLDFRLDTDSRIQTDWVCGEPHRDVAGVKGAKAYR